MLHQRSKVFVESIRIENRGVLHSIRTFGFCIGGSTEAIGSVIEPIMIRCMKRITVYTSIKKSFLVFQLTMDIFVVEIHILKHAVVRIPVIETAGHQLVHP